MFDVELNMAEKRNGLSLGRGLFYVCAAALMVLGCYNSSSTETIKGQIVGIGGYSGTYSIGPHYGVIVKRGNETFDISVPFGDSSLAKKNRDMGHGNPSSPPDSIEAVVHREGFKLLRPVLVADSHRTW